MLIVCSFSPPPPQKQEKGMRQRDNEKVTQRITGKESKTSRKSPEPPRPKVANLEEREHRERTGEDSTEKKKPWENRLTEV